MVENKLEIPEQIPNMQICYVLSFLRDWHYSIGKSQAADQADGFPVLADMTRLKDRIADIKVQWGFLANVPLLDCPESHGILQHKVPKLEEISEPENKDVKLIMNYIRMMHFEFVTCQSARMITGIQIHDKLRGETYFDSLEKLVTEYIDPRTPNDWPDAAPEEAQVGGGHTGV